MAIILSEGNVPGANEPKVVVDGDSITFLATPALHQRLDQSYDLQVFAIIGARINQSLPALESALRMHPYAVVENVGTNDALQGGTHPDWEASWDKLIRVLRTTPCVVLTTINPNADALRHRSVATRINADIRALAARDSKKYKVADWSRFLSRHKSSQRIYLRAEPVLIHPTPAGDQELASLDQVALAKCGRRFVSHAALDRGCVPFDFGECGPARNRGEVHG